MKSRIRDFGLIFLLTLGLGYTASRVMDLWFLRLVFPETIALDDIYWEDFSFKLRSNNFSEERIVLVNVATGGRREIAQQLMQVSKYKPRVIGVDVFFNCYEGKRDSINCPQAMDTVGNIMLSNALKEAGNVVMVSKLLQTKAMAQNNGDEEIYDSIEYSDEQFMKYAHHGFGNQVVRGDFRESGDNVNIEEVREFMPKTLVNEKRELSLGVQIARMYDSVLTDKFLKRTRPTEWISFRGSATPYRYELGDHTIVKPAYLRLIDSDSLTSGLYPKSTFEDKIVLVGYLGDYLNDPAFESRFYTPLNPTFAGRSMPDMLGITIQANIASMILNEDYINEFNSFFTWAITFLVLIVNIQFFIWLHRKQTTWYDSLCFIIPVLQIVVYSWMRLELLAGLNFRMEFEGIIYLIVFVSFAVNLYYGPILSLGKSLSSRLMKS